MKHLPSICNLVICRCFSYMFALEYLLFTNRWNLKHAKLISNQNKCPGLGNRSFEWFYNLMFVCLVWRNSTGSWKSNLDLFSLHSRRREIKKTCLLVRTDRCHLWNTKILKEIFSFLFFLFVSKLCTVLLYQRVWLEFFPSPSFAWR